MIKKLWAKITNFISIQRGEDSDNYTDSFQKRVISKIKNTKYTTANMGCPACGQLLQKSLESKHYETLEEHVCCSNDDLPERYPWICTNSECILNFFEIFWDDIGDVYNVRFFMKNQLKLYKDRLYPIGSFVGFYEDDKLKCKNRTWVVNWGKYQIKFFPFCRLGRWYVHSWVTVHRKTSYDNYHTYNFVFNWPEPNIDLLKYDKN